MCEAEAEFVFHLKKKKSLSSILELRNVMQGPKLLTSITNSGNSIIFMAKLNKYFTECGLTDETKGFQRSP